MFRYKLRTLLILLAVGPPLLAGLLVLTYVVWATVTLWPEHY